MSPSALDEEITVDEADLTVTKTFLPDELAMPAIRFRITSTATQPQTVRITESLPDSFSVDDIGFHPRFDKEGWTAYQDNRLVYQRTIEPDEPRETVYGLRIEDPADAEALMVPPEVTIVDDETAPLSGTETDVTTIADIAPATDTTAVKDLLSAADASPSRSAPSSSPFKTADEEHDATDSVPTATASESSSHPSESDDDQSTTDQPLVTQLAAELERGVATDEELATIRNALDVASTRRMDARISHLQSRVEDRAAYEDALEEFLDAEYDRMIPELQADVSDLATTVEELTERIADIESEQSTDDVTAELEALETQLDTIESEIETMEAEIAALQDWRNHLSETFSSID